MKFNKEQKEMWKKLSNAQQISLLTLSIEKAFQNGIDKLKENSKWSLLIAASLSFLFSLIFIKLFINNSYCNLYILCLFVIYLIYSITWALIRMMLSYKINNEIKIKTKLQLSLEEELNGKS